ncbi:MAG: hypothetical protein R2873_15790 [Caldilineaceae bacterium]
MCAGLEQGNAQRIPQVGGSYQPSPSAEDFAIPVTWTARRAFNFIRGVQAWGVRFTVQRAGAPLRLSSALAWTDDPAEPGSVVGKDGLVLVGMAEGTLIAESA